MQLARRVLHAYAAAGGGLLAGGLAYAALFALVPAVLLVLGLAGLLLGEREVRASFVADVVAVVPPIRALLAPAMEELALQAASMTFVGALGLAWAASRFYDAFETACARVFGGASRRGFVARTVRGLLSVAVLGAVFGVMTVLAGLRAFIEAASGSAAAAFAGPAEWLIDLAGPAATIAAVALVYRLVPPRRPAWRAIAGPSVAVTVALVVLVRLFVFLAPRLIGAAAVLGTLATVFAALAWLGLAFQAILLGAASVDALDRELARRRDVGGGRPATDDA
jgi:membrane protein